MDRSGGERIGGIAAAVKKLAGPLVFYFPESDVTSLFKVQGVDLLFSLPISTIEGEMSRRRRGIG